MVDPPVVGVNGHGWYRWPALELPADASQPPWRAVMVETETPWLIKLLESRISNEGDLEGRLFVAHDLGERKLTTPQALTGGDCR